MPKMGILFCEPRNDCVEVKVVSHKTALGKHLLGSTIELLKIAGKKMAERRRIQKRILACVIGKQKGAIQFFEQERTNDVFV